MSEKKGYRRTSKAASDHHKAALNVLEGEALQSIGDFQFGSWVEQDGLKQIAILEAPASLEQCQEIGAPAELYVQGGADGLMVRLRDTSQRPRILSASAHVERLKLAKNAGVADLAADLAATIEPTNSLERMLGDQLAAAHAHGMRLIEKAAEWLEDGQKSPITSTVQSSLAAEEAARLTVAAARMMSAFQSGMVTLAKIRAGGQRVTVVHQHVHVTGHQVAVAGSIKGGGMTDDRG